MRIHKEGSVPILSVTISSILLISLLFLFYPGKNHIVPVIVTVLCVFFTLFIIRFFRVPARIINKVDKGVISPADGTVIAVEESYENEFFKDNRLKISIFMSIYNVHVNFFPCDGKVEYVKYHPGKYFVAHLPKSSTDNEHNTVVVKKNEREIVLFRQIAGFVARRIVSKIEEGMEAVQGEEMGIIRFGSRVDVFLPLDVEVAVKNGDKVTAQKSVLAYF